MVVVAAAQQFDENSKLKMLAARDQRHMVLRSVRTVTGELPAPAAFVCMIGALRLRLIHRESNLAAGLTTPILCCVCTVVHPMNGSASLGPRMGARGVMARSVSSNHPLCTGLWVS
jgi:hypothetical protein